VDIVHSSEYASNRTFVKMAKNDRPKKNNKKLVTKAFNKTHVTGNMLNYGKKLFKG
jgi:hypothetical protein